jgi:hypothetical protein
MTATSTGPSSDEPVERVSRLCLALPGTSERLSHGEPTFFAGRRVFVMFADNHHGDGRVAVWLPAPPGVQSALIEQSPAIYFRPPYVGHKGWVGIELAHVNDDDLEFHIQTAWQLIAPKRLVSGNSGEN